MKLIIQVLIGAAVLIGALWLLNVVGAIVGLLFWLLIAGVIGAAIYGTVAGRLKEQRELKGPNRREERKQTKAVEKEISNLEERLKK